MSVRTELDVALDEAVNTLHGLMSANLTGPYYDADLKEHAITAFRLARMKRPSSDELWWTPNAPIGGTSFSGVYLDVATLGGFYSVVGVIALMAGEPQGDRDKTTVQFVGQFRGHIFTLYDYKRDRELHIGCFRSPESDAWVADLRLTLRNLLSPRVL